MFFAFRHVVTVRTPIGRAIRPKVLAHHSGPLVRVKRQDLTAAGIERVPRVVGTTGGRPVLADGRELDVANVIWCTGFRPDDGWLGRAAPMLAAHRRGVIPDEPGLYLVGREFVYALSSAMIQGVGRDARHVARHIARSSGSAGQRQRSA